MMDDRHSLDDIPTSSDLNSARLATAVHTGQGSVDSATVDHKNERAKVFSTLFFSAMRDYYDKGPACVFHTAKYDSLLGRFNKNNHFHREKPKQQASLPTFIHKDAIAREARDSQHKYPRVLDARLLYGESKRATQSNLMIRSEKDSGELNGHPENVSVPDRQFGLMAVDEQASEESGRRRRYTEAGSCRDKEERIFNRQDSRSPVEDDHRESIETSECESTIPLMGTDIIVCGKNEERMSSVQLNSDGSSSDDDKPKKRFLRTEFEGGRHHFATRFPTAESIGKLAQKEASEPEFTVNTREPVQRATTSTVDGERNPSLADLNLHDLADEELDYELSSDDDIGRDSQKSAGSVTNSMTLRNDDSSDESLIIDFDHA